MKFEAPASEVDRSRQWSKGERAAIVEELDRILAHPTFKNSTRCQALLRYLVERALVGHWEGLKERTLGIEVFGRAPDYDTAAEPVVRIAANEIRKRLAQWYLVPARHQQVRIHLPAGAYLPRFDFIHHECPPETEEAKPAEELPKLIELQRPATRFDEPSPVTISTPITTTRAWTGGRIWIWACAAILAVSAIFLAAQQFGILYSKDYVLWRPMLDSSQPMILCVPLVSRNGWDGTQSFASVIADRQAPSSAAGADSLPRAIPMSDAEDVQKIDTWLAAHHGNAELRDSEAVSLSDLRQRPVVLIGGYNPWSLILLSNLRYSVRVDPTTHVRWIQDVQNPSSRTWQVGAPPQRTGTDFAIVTRVLDAETGKWILSMGGIGAFGTQAAVDLLTDHSFIHELPAGLKTKGNFQIVLKSSIINGSAGPPQVLAFYAW